MKIYREITIDMESGVVLHEDSYEYSGPIMRCGGGPSAAQVSLANQESAFYSELTADYAQSFSEQQANLAKLTNALAPTIAAGPNQQGFSSSQLAGLNTQALDTTGANYANAARALQGQLAGRGGNSGLVGGPQQQVSSVLASQAQGQLSSEENQINEANWEQGEANYNTAIASLSGVTGLESPLGYANAGNNANELAYNEANIDNEESQQGIASTIGAVGGLVGAGAGIASDFLMPPTPQPAPAPEGY